MINSNILGSFSLFIGSKIGNPFPNKESLHTILAYNNLRVLFVNGKTDFVSKELVLSVANNISKGLPVDVKNLAMYIPNRELYFIQQEIEFVKNSIENYNNNISKEYF